MAMTKSEGSARERRLLGIIAKAQKERRPTPPYWQIVEELGMVGLFAANNLGGMLRRLEKARRVRKTGKGQWEVVGVD